MLWMDEIAVATSFTRAFVVLTAFGFSEVCDWTIFYVHLFHIIIPPILIFKALLGLFLIRKLNKNVANHMVANVVSNEHLDDLTVLAKLGVYLRVELFSMSSCCKKLLLWNTKTSSEGNGGAWILVELEEKQGLTERRLVVLASAAITVSAGTYFVIEGTVDFVVLGTELFSESFCH